MTKPEPFNWTCWSCGREQVTTSNCEILKSKVDINGSKYGSFGVTNIITVCANKDCGEISAVSTINTARVVQLSWVVFDNELLKIGEIPSVRSIAQPEYIPAPLREDYAEACAIERLSPKASATLSRRCLQGMIRDFCNISRSRLVDEIKELKRQVSAGQAPRGVVADVIDAIDAVREIGNIGAHMERDINTIVEIDPDEARILIGLIELLFKEWYVARHDRQERIAKITAIQADKTAQKLLPSPKQPA